MVFDQCNKINTLINSPDVSTPGLFFKTTNKFYQMPWSDLDDDIFEGIGEAISDFGAWLGWKGFVIVLVIFLIAVVFLYYT